MAWLLGLAACCHGADALIKASEQSLSHDRTDNNEPRATPTATATKRNHFDHEYRDPVLFIYPKQASSPAKYRALQEFDDCFGDEKPKKGETCQPTVSPTETPTKSPTVSPTARHPYPHGRPPRCAIVPDSPRTPPRSSRANRRWRGPPDR